MDDKRNRGQPDRSLINTHEPWEVEYWSKKFGVSPLTVVAWLKAAGVKGSSNKVAKKASKAAPAKKAAKAAKAAKKVNGVASNGGFSAKLTSLLSLSGLIDKAEAELAQLKAKFSALKASL